MAGLFGWKAKNLSKFSALHIPASDSPVRALLRDLIGKLTIVALPDQKGVETAIVGKAKLNIASRVGIFAGDRGLRLLLALAPLGEVLAAIKTSDLAAISSSEFRFYCGSVAMLKAMAIGGAREIPGAATFDLEAEPGKDSLAAVFLQGYNGTGKSSTLSLVRLCKYLKLMGTLALSKEGGALLLDISNNTKRPTLIANFLSEIRGALKVTLELPAGLALPKTVHLISVPMQLIDNAEFAEGMAGPVSAPNFQTLHGVFLALPAFIALGHELCHVGVEDIDDPLAKKTALALLISAEAPGNNVRTEIRRQFWSTMAAQFELASVQHIVRGLELAIASNTIGDLLMHLQGLLADRALPAPTMANVAATLSCSGLDADLLIMQLAAALGEIYVACGNPAWKYTENWLRQPYNLGLRGSYVTVHSDELPTSTWKTTGAFGLTGGQENALPSSPLASGKPAKRITRQFTSVGGALLPFAPPAN